MSDNDKRFDRRSVLKAIGTTAVVGAGLGASTGNVAAIETKQRLTEAYHDEMRLRTAFARHGAGLRANLVEEGFVSEDFEFASVGVDLDADVTGLEPSADDRLAGVTAVFEEGTATAFGMLSTSSDTHEISLFVQPERDLAYAMAEPKDGGDRVIVTESDVTPTGCSYQSCGSCCTTDYKTLKTYDCDPDCTNCQLWDTECSCKDEDAC